MANRTIQGALTVRGTNPQFLIDNMVRNKIYSCRYWKESCTGLTAESLVDEAIKLEYVGGTYGGTRQPCKFLVLILKMLQIQPDKDIVLEYIRNEDYKYVSAMALFYWRMVATAEECYKVIEEYYSDFRKIRYRNEDGSFKIVHIDEFADSLLTQEVFCSTVLPHIQTRINMEEAGNLKQRVSILEQELEKELLKEQEEKEKQEKMDLENENNNNDSDDNKEKKKRRRSYSRSESYERHKKSKKDKKKKKKSDKKSSNDWRKVVKGKHKKQKRSRSRSNSNRREEGPTKAPPPKDSIEAENILRASLGMSLLPTK